MKILLPVTIMALIAFIGAAIVAPPLSQMQTRGRFTELDRACVINVDALSAFHPSYRFMENVRANVPDYIAGDTIERMESMAWSGAGMAFVNLVVISGNLWIARDRRRRSVADAPVADRD